MIRPTIRGWAITWWSAAMTMTLSMFTVQDSLTNPDTPMTYD